MLQSRRACRRAKLTREVIALVKDTYGGNIKIFGASQVASERYNFIPRSVRVTEASASGVSIFTHDPNGKVAAAYSALVREVLANG
jgi:chromosome partitioning protein